MTKKIQFRAFIPPIMSAIRTGGDSMRLTFDVPESDLLAAIALIALRDTPLRITVEVDTSPVATRVPQKEQNAYSEYWRLWFKPDSRGASPLFSIQLRDALKLDGEAVTTDTVHEALKAALGVFSLSREVSPDIFEAWLDTRKLEGLINRSKQIRAKLEEEHAKAS